MLVSPVANDAITLLAECRTATGAPVMGMTARAAAWAVAPNGLG
jgi:hypothetical protein